MSTTPTISNTNFIDSLLTELKSSGRTELISFIEGNYSIILDLGLDIFNQLVQLFKDGRVSDAQLMLDGLMSPDSNIARTNTIASNLNVKIAQWNAFKADLEKFAIQLAPAVIKLALSVSTGGISSII